MQGNKVRDLETDWILGSAGSILRRIKNIFLEDEQSLW
jgi:hypothetical protein